MSPDWLRWQESLHARPIDMGLERVREVLGRLGPAARRPGRVITVAGTNGKGSTITLLHDCLRAAGARPGPVHLSASDPLQRADPDRQAPPSTDAELLRAFERVEAARRRVPLTYFEFGTLAASCLSCRRGVRHLAAGGGPWRATRRRERRRRGSRADHHDRSRSPGVAR